MAKCASCRSTILFGGVEAEEGRYCNDDCHRRGMLVAVSRRLPEEVVRERVGEVHRGLCPACSGPGPVDVFTNYRVWSALLLTSWSNRPEVSCRRCATRSQLGSATFSLLLGWWGLPWGVIMTPVQIVRNLVALSKRPDPYEPSEKLEELVRAALAEAALTPAENRG